MVHGSSHPPSLLFFYRQGPEHIQIRHSGSWVYEDSGPCVFKVEVDDQDKRSERRHTLPRYALSLSSLVRPIPHSTD